MNYRIVMPKVLLLAFVALSFGFVQSEPAPLFKSPRKFYRPGDTIQVSIEQDTSIEVAFCTSQKKANVYYRIEKLDGDVWKTVFNTTSICQASMPATMKAGKGFTIKHFLLDEGRFRVVVSDQYRSTEFELR
jgi:hypothetical protein